MPHSPSLPHHRRASSPSLLHSAINQALSRRPQQFPSSFPLSPKPGSAFSLPSSLPIFSGSQRTASSQGCLPPPLSQTLHAAKATDPSPLHLHSKSQVIASTAASSPLHRCKPTPCTRGLTSFPVRVHRPAINWIPTALKSRASSSSSASCRPACCLLGTIAASTPPPALLIAAAAPESIKVPSRLPHSCQTPHSSQVIPPHPPPPAPPVRRISPHPWTAAAGEQPPASSSPSRLLIFLTDCCQSLL